jgi:hypothetical protein
MAGTIRRMLDTIISERARGNPTVAGTTRTKLILKGLNPDRFDPGVPDDPAVVKKVLTVAAEFGVTLRA